MLPLFRRLFGTAKEEPAPVTTKRSTSLRLDHSCARNVVDHQRVKRDTPLQSPRPKQ
ncbi:MAG: hypothetical protein JNM56_10110 [Planctomycetia bacterium]|nr:hypothetical protein [Planctomycetia bacterium]